MKDLQLIAVTGGIGSGKSTVIKLIGGMGYYTVDCDEITKELYSKRSFLRKVKKLFPTAVKGKLKLSLDKKELSKIAFSSPEKLKELADLIHPIVLKTAISRAKKFGVGKAFVEVPLLFEGGYETLFDNVIVVARNKEERIRAVMVRSNLSEQEVLMRLKHQIDYDTFDFSKYISISNMGDFDMLDYSVKAMINSL